MLAKARRRKQLIDHMRKGVGGLIRNKALDRISGWRQADDVKVGAADQ